MGSHRPSSTSTGRGHSWLTSTRSQCRLPAGGGGAGGLDTSTTHDVSLLHPGLGSLGHPGSTVQDKVGLSSVVGDGYLFPNPPSPTSDSGSSSHVGWGFSFDSRFGPDRVPSVPLPARSTAPFSVVGTSLGTLSPSSFPEALVVPGVRTTDPPCSRSGTGHSGEKTRGLRVGKN